MGILKKVRDKTGTVHELGDSRVDAFETELSGAEHNVPYSPAVLGKANAIEKKIDDHAADRANPHGVTKEQLGLANVENKSSTQIRSEITKENVTAALGYTPIDESRIGAANGVASLDAGGRIPASQIPGGFDNIDEYDSLADFPETGEEGKIYVARDTNLTYRWTGTQYVEISPSLALGETATTAYRGDRGKAAYDHSQISGDSTIHHAHANKELLDSYTQTEADLANAVARVHEHGNKAVLDGITAEKVEAWDSKQQALTFDTTPTSGSTNPVTSGGVKSALDDTEIVVLNYGQKPTKKDGTTYTFSELKAIAKQLRLFVLSGIYVNVNLSSIKDNYIRWSRIGETGKVNNWDLSASLVWSDNYVELALKSNLTNESTARADADTALDNRIATLEGKTKLSDFEDDITTGTYSETGTAPVNGQAVASAVGAESTERSNADTALQGNIDNEATTRSDADTALGGRIDTVDAKGLTVKEIDGEQVLCFE